MDYDFKCNPWIIGTREVDGLNHLCFSTVPWWTIAEFNHFRGLWDKYRVEHKVCMKTEADLYAFIKFAYARFVSPDPSFRYSHNHGLVRSVLPLVAAGMRFEKWGLSMKGRSMSQWSEWFRKAGFHMTIDVMKKATERPSDHCVPVLGPVNPLIEHLKTEFTDLDVMTMDACHRIFSSGE